MAHEPFDSPVTERDKRPRPFIILMLIGPSRLLCRYYSATILQMAGVRDDKQAIWLTTVTSATNFVFSLVGVWLVDKVGRRKLTLGSLLGLYYYSITVTSRCHVIKHEPSLDTVTFAVLQELV